LNRENDRARTTAGAFAFRSETQFSTSVRLWDDVSGVRRGRKLQHEVEKFVVAQQPIRGGGEILILNKSDHDGTIRQ
jgi:hypothetical protein